MRDDIASMNRKGFSTIELLVVIAIIGILAMIVTNINFNRITAEEKGVRITNSIGSLIRTEVSKNTLGKAIPSGTDFIYPTLTTVVIGTGGVQVTYYSGSTSIAGDAITTPFFWDPLYSILAMTGSSRDATYSIAGTDVAVIELVPGAQTELYYSWATRQKIHSLGILTGYNGQTKTIEFDSRTNVVKY